MLILAVKLTELSKGVSIHYRLFIELMQELPLELESQITSLSRAREENRKLRSDFEALRIAYDDEIYNSSSWRKEKERLETKIFDLEKACGASSGAQAEQQTQIVTLHSQIRELRSVLDDTEADRTLLQKARRALQAELDCIKLDNADNNNLSSDREYQKMQLRKQDLERLLEEQEERISYANERAKRAETFANEFQVELGRIRVENSELDKINVCP